MKKNTQIILFSYLMLLSVLVLCLYHSNYRTNWVLQGKMFSIGCISLILSATALCLLDFFLDAKKSISSSIVIGLLSGVILFSTQDNRKRNQNTDYSTCDIANSQEMLISSPYWIPIHGDTLTDGGSRILTLINDVGQIIHIKTTVEYPSSGREVYILKKNYSGPHPIRVIPGTELAETLNKILHNIDTEVRGGDISIDLEVLHSLLDRK